LVGFRDEISREGDGKVRTKAVPAGAGSYAVCKRAGRTAKIVGEGGEKSIREEPLLLT